MNLFCVKQLLLVVILSRFVEHETGPLRMFLELFFEIAINVSLNKYTSLTRMFCANEV